MSSLWPGRLNWGQHDFVKPLLEEVFADAWWRNVCFYCRVKAKLQETSPERVEPFMANAQAEVKKIIGNIKNFQVSMCAHLL